jgi:hypothetical protein
MGFISATRLSLSETDRNHHRHKDIAVEMSDNVDHKVLDLSAKKPFRCPLVECHDMLLKSCGISFVGLLLLACNAWAGTPALEGVVKDLAGHPIKGADLRIEARNGSSFSRIVKTDATGHYTSDRLAVGIYKVTLVVNGAVKASILNAQTQSGKPTQLNFELTPKTTPSKKHMVWIPGETGTHIGNGQWVEVDDNNNVVRNSTAENSVDKSSGNDVKAMQMSTGRFRSPGGP